MAEWRNVTLGELFSVKHGFAFQGEYFSDTPQKYSLVTPGNFSIGGGFKNDKEKFYDGPIPQGYMLSKGDVIVTMTDLSKNADTLGYSAIIPTDNKWLHNQRIGLLLFNFDIKIDHLFISYLLRTNTYRQWIINSATGSTVKHTSPSRIEQFRTKIPPFSEQQSIAHILGTLDDKIELNRRQNATLEAMAQAIFKDWFVDFGPVRAKMEGRQPEGMSREIADLFPDRLDDEGKPEGWKWGTLGEYAQLNPESWSKKNYPDKICYVDLSNTKWGTIESISHYEKEKAPSRAQRVLRIGDTIIGTVRPGNGSFAYIGCNGLTGSTGFAVLRPRKEIYKEFIYCAATDKYNIERISFLADGGAYPAVKAEIVLDTHVCICRESVMKVFSMLLADIMKKIEENKKQNLNLALIRDTLLPKLISGELRVPDAEKMVADIV